MKRPRIFPCLLLIPLSLIFTSLISEAASLSPKADDKRVLVRKLAKSLSLNELIRSEGYSINDEDVFNFLSAFNELNPSIKSISSIKSGSTIKIPVRHLRKADAGSVQTGEIIRQPVGHRERTSGKKRPESGENRPFSDESSLIMMNISKLFLSLGDNISVEHKGLKYFPLSEKSDVIFDTGLYPVITLNNKNIFVFDYDGVFPEEIKNLLEIAWPEYRVLNPHGRSDLRSIVALLLQASGYHFDENSRILSGGQVQVEYRTDFLVHGRDEKVPDMDIALISILGWNEFVTPADLVSWFMKRDIKIIELSARDRKYFNRNPGQVAEIDKGLSGAAFTRNLLETIGYRYKNNETIRIGSNKSMQYSIKADLLVDMGYRKKIIEFSGISDHDAKYVRKMGIDIAVIEPWETRKEIVDRILSFLSLAHSENSNKRSAMLNPRPARYRILLPGVSVNTIRGPFLMTDADIDAELLRSILNEGISVLRF